MHKILIFIISLFLTFNAHATIYEVDSNADMIAANANADDDDLVDVREGTYTVGIAPANSGTENHEITYKARDGEEVIITGVSIGVDLKYRHYIIVDGIKILDTSYWVSMSYGAASYNIIRNCHMEETSEYVGILFLRGAHHNKIQDNILIGYCGTDDLIQIMDSSYNLIEGNKLYYGTHSGIDIQDRTDGTTSYNIIRNNYIQNKWHGGVDLIGLENVLCENNIIADSGEDHENNWCGSERDRDMARNIQRGVKLGCNNSIIRNNVFINDGYGFSFSSYDSWKGLVTNNRIYHNTLNRNYHGMYRNTVDIAAENIIKNNIFYDNREWEIFVASASLNENYYINNSILGASVKYGSEDTIQDTFAVNPLLVDADGSVSGSPCLFPIAGTACNTGLTSELKYNNTTNEVDSEGDSIVFTVDNRDLSLKTNSSMIDVGAWLTTITSATGSGTSFFVDDARYFMDGWGIIDGDKIQLEGQLKVVEITSINYSTDTITVASSVFWTQGDGVSTPYKNFAPDIGAYEVPERRHIPAVNSLLLN